jgi:hypothetical protein
MLLGSSHFWILEPTLQQCLQSFVTLSQTSRGISHGHLVYIEPFPEEEDIWLGDPSGARLSHKLKHRFFKKWTEPRTATEVKGGNFFLIYWGNLRTKIETI